MSNNNGTARAEYFQKKAFKISPLHVPFVKVSKNGTVTTNFANGGTLNRVPRNSLNDMFMASIIIQVLGTLEKIHKEDPSFRHGYVQPANIIIDPLYAPKKKEVLHGLTVPYVGGRALITKFGGASDSSKPLANNAGKDMMYDAHFFLNKLFSQTLESENVGSKVPETIKFLRRILPQGYKGASGMYVTGYHLKNGVSFPSYTAIFSDPYFAPFKNRNGPVNTGISNNLAQNVGAMFAEKKVAPSRLNKLKAAFARKKTENAPAVKKPGVLSRLRGLFRRKNNVRK